MRLWLAGVILLLVASTTLRSQTVPGPVFSQWSTFCEGVEHTAAVALGADHIYLNEDRGGRWIERALGLREPGDAPRATGVAIGDVDGDRDLDIVIPGRYEARSAVYINDGKAGFAETRAVGSTTDDTTSVALGDVDGDGDADIVMGNDCQPNHVFFNPLRGPKAITLPECRF